MLAYNDLSTYTFVCVYDKSCVTRDALWNEALTRLVGIGCVITKEPGAEHPQILEEDICNVALLEYRGAQVFAEVKSLDDRAPNMIELQIGSSRNSYISLFSAPWYDVAVRNTLLSSIESLVALQGFEFGYSLHLAGFENEGEYREWVSDCIVDGNVSFERVVNHDFLSIHAIFAGGSTCRRYGMKKFEACPAWRTSRPSSGTICIWFDEVMPAAFDKVSFKKEAVKYLRTELGGGASGTLSE